MKLFDRVQVPRVKSNVFDLSHELKLTCNMGELIPTYVQEVVPGDKFKMNTEQLIRLAPLVAPLMHRVDVFHHNFFVPNRIIWDNWEQFITGGEKGDAMPVHPYFEVKDSIKTWFTKSLLPDYMGVPVTDGETTIANPLKVNALPFRAFQEIYNYYYRDEVLTDPIDFSKGDGESAQADVSALTQMRYRAWQKDYFTSAQIESQKGGDVGIPVDIRYKSQSDVRLVDGQIPAQTDYLSTEQTNGYLTSGGASKLRSRIENLDETAMNVPINDLRLSARLQEWLEKNARGGSRYKETLLHHFNVMGDDARLQKPQFLSGSKNPVVISEVLNTAGSQDGQDPALQPVGEMAGHGISMGSGNGFSRYFKEHGFVISIMSIVPKSSYHQGVDKMFTREDKFDYYWPSFAHLGEQPIKNKELYVEYYGSDVGENTFGYQSRFSEYKFKPSRVAGDFKDTLSHWTMVRNFDQTPALNDSFIKSDPTHRIFAVTDPTVDKLYVQLYHNIKARRPMPYFGTPRL